MDVHDHRFISPEGGQSSNQKKTNVIGKIEFFQRPKLLDAFHQEATNENDVAYSSVDGLGPRPSGDGSDHPQPSPNGYFTESPDRRYCLSFYKASIIVNSL